MVLLLCRRFTHTGTAGLMEGLHRLGVLFTLLVVEEVAVPLIRVLEAQVGLGFHTHLTCEPIRALMVAVRPIAREGTTVFLLKGLFHHAAEGAAAQFLLQMLSLLRVLAAAARLQSPIY